MELLLIVLNLLVCSPKHVNLYNYVEQNQETICEQELQGIHDFIIHEDM